jgi:hypothetical protein
MYKLWVKTSSRACIQELPHALWLRISHPYQGGLRHCHVSYGSRPHVLVEVGSDTGMCPAILDLTSRLRWAPMLPHVLWLRTSPLGWGGLWRYHMSHASRLHLPAEVGCDTAMCPMALDLASRLWWPPVLWRVQWFFTLPLSWGGLRCCHISYGSGSRLLAEVGIDCTTCPTSLNLAS